MITFPNAKINIGLNVLERRPDGYHNISTVMYPVKWCDILEIIPSDDIRLVTSGLSVECDPDRNLVVKALKAVENYCCLNLNCDIYLHKIIPDGAGLGGGSSDAAHMVKLLNETFELGLSEADMLAISARIGADCPFFILNRPLIATGIGEILTPVDIDLSNKKILIVKPQESISTAMAYEGVKPAIPDVDVSEVVKHPISEWKNLLYNDFEPVVYKYYPKLETVKRELYAAGAVYASMSGSGSAFFGIFQSEADNLAEVKMFFEKTGMKVYSGII